jgi:hypothetical protein
MATRDDEVDGLFQVPLVEFTASRNALAKARGKAGAPVRALPKPATAAWAVNQLYWHQRAIYDAVVTAGDRRRAAHARVLAGKGGDVSTAERAHHDAISAAVRAAREALRAVGDAATTATIQSVTDTLHGLPGPEPPGQLTKPLKPLGLEALAGLVTKAGKSFARAAAGGTPSAPITPGAKRAAAADARHLAADARRAEKARQREVAVLEKAVTAAQAAERKAELALEAARKALDGAQREHERLADQLQFALKQIQDRRDEIARGEQHRREATAERERLLARLDALKC